ncbi:MAG TPA: DsbE family thiol:disulfide interchange protein [Woeseiaceae bacterium]|nr:DsbE family thiol:disulfide interchange protein [Woeseiaceae bacterium]
MNRYLWPLIGVGALIVFLVLGLLHGDPRALPSPFIGKAAPEFELPTLKNPEVTIGKQNLLGQYSIVNVWATWCVMCKVEHRFLLDLAASRTIPIYGINWRDSRPDAIGWLNELGDPYIASAYDADGRVGIDWGVYGAPETFLVDPEGTVIYKHLGPLDKDIWQREFVARMTDGGGQ